MITVNSYRQAEGAAVLTSTPKDDAAAIGSPRQVAGRRPALPRRGHRAAAAISRGFGALLCPHQSVASAGAHPEAAYRDTASNIACA